MDTIRPPASETNDIADVTEETFNLLDEMEQGNWQRALWRLKKVESFIYQKMFLRNEEPDPKNVDRPDMDDYRNRVKERMRRAIRRSQGTGKGD